MKNAVVGAALLLASTITPQPGADQNWKEWGGPKRDFNASGTGVFPNTGTKWLATPPKKLWERQLGDGYSAIAVEDGTLYTAYRRDADDVVVALDAATGRTLWEYGYAAPFKNAYLGAVGPGPYAMPADHRRSRGDRGIGQIHSIDKKPDGRCGRGTSMAASPAPSSVRLFSHALPTRIR